MNILLTGAAGFLGGHVAERLIGHEVVGVDSLDPRVHASGIAPSWAPANLVVSEVGHIPYWAHMDAEVVIHLAAQVGVADSMTDPLRYIEGNTAQTAAMLKDLNVAAHRNLKRLVVASSMSVYGDGGLRVSEDHPCVPTSVYGLTKYDQERLCLMWGKQHGVEVVALRFFNIYGPRQALTNPYTGVLANFAQAILHGQSPTVYEDGGQSRDFIYVTDVADAVAQAATTSLPMGGVYNVCTGHATTILHAASQLIVGLEHPELDPHITHTLRPGDIRHCTGNPKMLHDALGWEASMTFDAGIWRYAEWLLEQRGIP